MNQYAKGCSREDLQEDSTLNDERNVVRFERENVSTETSSLAEEDRVDEPSHSRANFDRSSSSVIENT